MYSAELGDIPRLNGSGLNYIYFTCFLHFLAFSMVAVPINAKINLSLNGDANETTSVSSFMITTVYGVGQFTKLITAKYNAALADYIGRKPILMLAASAGLIKCLLFATSEIVEFFYIASFIAGYFDCFYNVCLAWISDIVDPESRGKGFGPLTGFSVGFGFALGIPIGALVSETSGPDVAFYMAATVHITNFMVIFLLPLTDTLSSMEKKKRVTRESVDNGKAIDVDNKNSLTEYNDSAVSSPVHNVMNPTESGKATRSTSSSTHKSSSDMIDIDQMKNTGFFMSVWNRLKADRSLPDDWNQFLRENSPISGIKLIREARCPQDWITNFLLQISQQVLQTIFISFGIEIFGFSVAETGILFATLALSIVLVSPLLRSRFEEPPLAFWGAAVQAVGYFFLSIAGSGKKGDGVSYVGYVGLLPLAVGGIWVSAIQTMLTKYYEKDRQGESTGVLSQQNVLAIVPAYPVALLFSYSLTKESEFYWPGVSFAFCVIFHSLACILHYRTHGSEGIFMIRKSKKASNEAIAAKAATLTDMDVEISGR